MAVITDLNRGFIKYLGVFVVVVLCWTFHLGRVWWILALIINTRSFDFSGTGMDGKKCSVWMFLPLVFTLFTSAGLWIV